MISQIVKVLDNGMMVGFGKEATLHGLETG
jgi:hypothetical protein